MSALERAENTKTTKTISTEADFHGTHKIKDILGHEPPKAKKKYHNKRYMQKRGASNFSNTCFGGGWVIDLCSLHISL